MFGIDKAGKEAGSDAAGKLATAAEEVVQTATLNAADAVSCIVGALDRLTAMGREQSEKWRGTVERFAGIAEAFLVDIHITNRKE